MFSASIIPHFRAIMAHLHIVISVSKGLETAGSSRPQQCQCSWKAPGAQRFQPEGSHSGPQHFVRVYS